jgi:hypothetical protein
VEFGPEARSPGALEFRRHSPALLLGVGWLSLIVLPQSLSRMSAVIYSSVEPYCDQWGSSDGGHLGCCSPYLLSLKSPRFLAPSRFFHSPLQHVAFLGAIATELLFLSTQNQTTP